MHQSDQLPTSHSSQLDNVCNFIAVMFDSKCASQTPCKRTLLVQNHGHRSSAPPPSVLRSTAMTADDARGARGQPPNGRQPTTASTSSTSLPAEREGFAQVSCLHLFDGSTSRRPRCFTCPRHPCFVFSLFGKELLRINTSLLCPLCQTHLITASSLST